jgi:hypothetical protein
MKVFFTATRESLVSDGGAPPSVGDTGVTNAMAD